MTTHATHTLLHYDHALFPDLKLSEMSQPRSPETNIKYKYLGKIK